MSAVATGTKLYVFDAACPQDRRSGGGIPLHRKGRVWVRRKTKNSNAKAAGSKRGSRDPVYPASYGRKCSAMPGAYGSSSVSQ
jgi:hypothetical protein